MVNESLPARGQERALALSYAEKRHRPALEALLALDARLGTVVGATREPLVGQMRLAWWRGALAALDTAAPPAEPVLATLAAEVIPLGVTGVVLAGMVDGWERLLDAPWDDTTLVDFAAARGGRLFTIAGTIVGVDHAGLENPGEGWALADLSSHHRDPAVAARAMALARDRLGRAFHRRWSRSARALGALTLLAAADLDDVPPASPRRVGRLLWHRLTGR